MKGNLSLPIPQKERALSKPSYIRGFDDHPIIYSASMNVRQLEL
jgi:hypothetical protein